MREEPIRIVAPASIRAFEAKAQAICSHGQRRIRFGQFLVIPAARALELDGQPVYLGSRAFDLLIVLLRSRGTVVARADIMQYVWPSTYVDDANLRVQMAFLRRTLGEDGRLIKTVTGRGYVAIEDQQERENG
jgi:DNA-binding winged helix-turn-helix (wHTH) protein